MLNRIFVVDSVTLTSTGAAVSSYVPWDQSTRKLPTQVVIKATGQGAYVRLSNDNSAATNADTLVQAGDHVVLSVQGRRWVSVLSDGASSTVNVGALSTGVSGSAASLDLAFVDAGVLDPRVTFTRTGTNATYFNSAGVLVNAGADVPRFDYNPATLAAQGLLIEEARTNLLTRSEEFNDAAWVKTNSSITANATTAPSGTATADKLIEALDTNLVHQTTQSGVTVVSLATYTASVFVKADTRTRVRIGFLVGASGVVADANLTAGTIGAASAFGGGAAVGSAIQAINNGWYRISVSGSGAAGTSGEHRIELLDASGNRQYNGDGTSGLFIWGAQLEAGAFPTSYIPTTTTALTRWADVASVNTLSPWFNSTAGTLFAEFLVGNLSANGTAAEFGDGTLNNRFNIEAQPGTSLRTWARVAVSGALQIDIGINNTLSLTTPTKAALAIELNNMNLAANGTAGTTDTTCTVPTVNKLQLGNINTGSGAALNGWLRRLTFYPRRLSNAELQAITA